LAVMAVKPNTATKMDVVIVFFIVFIVLSLLFV